MIRPIFNRQNHHRQNRADTSRPERRTSRLQLRYDWRPENRCRPQNHTVRSCHSTNRCDCSTVQTDQPSRIVVPGEQQALSATVEGQSKGQAMGRAADRAKDQDLARDRVWDRVWDQAMDPARAFRDRRRGRRPGAGPVRRGNENHQA